MAAARTTLGSGRARTTKPGEGDEREHRPHAPRDADDDAQPEHESHDDGDVAARHGGQVRHARGAHRRGEVVGRAARVSDDESWQEPTGVGGRGVDRGAQAGAQVLGRCGHRARAARRLPGARTPPGSRRGRRPARWVRAVRAPAPWRARAASTRAASPVSRTGAPASRLMPRASTCRIVASRSTRAASPRPARTTGSPVTTTTAVTAARSAARLLDPAPGPQHAVASRGQLEEDDEGREQRARPAHGSCEVTDARRRPDARAPRDRPFARTGAATTSEPDTAATAATARCPRGPSPSVAAADGPGADGPARGAGGRWRSRRHPPGTLATHSQRHQRAELGEELLADAADLAELVDAREPAVLRRASRGCAGRAPDRRRAGCRARRGRRC